MSYIFILITSNDSIVKGFTQQIFSWKTAMNENRKKIIIVTMMMRKMYSTIVMKNKKLNIFKNMHHFLSL